MNVDCQEALDRLYELLDRELTPELETAVREHFERCADCFPVYRFESAFARFLHARRETRQAPEALRRGIMERIMSDNGSA